MVQHADIDHTGITGVGAGSNPQVTTIELGHASDTTLARASAGNITVEGNAIYRAGGTDVALADGGTGASLTDPNADRIMFWDDSAGQVTWLTAGTNLTITGTTIDAAGGGGASELESDKVKRTAGDVTTTSTTFVDLTGASITFTTGARRVMLAFAGSWYNSATATMALDFDVDGSRMFGGNFPNAWNINHANQAIPIGVTVVTDVLSAASHTFKVQWKVSSGTGTMQGSTDTPYIFSAVELYAD